MAVHLPISLEAQGEAKCLMLAGLQCLSTANGEPSVLPTQDMILGLYYLTLANPLDKLSGLRGAKVKDSLKQVVLEYERETLSIHDWVWIPWAGPIAVEMQKPFPLAIELSKDGHSKVSYTKAKCRKTVEGRLSQQYVQMAVGRILFNRIVHEAIDLSL